MSPEIRIEATRFDREEELLAALYDFAIDGKRIEVRKRLALALKINFAGNITSEDWPEAQAEEPKCPVCGTSLKSACELCVREGCSDDKAAFYCWKSHGGCARHWSRDSRGLYIRKRYEASDKSLVIDFWLRDKLLEMQVVEQDEGWRCNADTNSINLTPDQKIRSVFEPEIRNSILFVRGRYRRGDKELAHLNFPTTRAALEAMLEWGKLIQQVKLPEMVRPELRVGMRVNSGKWSSGPHRITGYDLVREAWIVYFGCDAYGDLPSDWQPVEDKP